MLSRIQQSLRRQRSSSSYKTLESSSDEDSFALPNAPERPIGPVQAVDPCIDQLISNLGGDLGILDLDGDAFNNEEEDGYEESCTTNMFVTALEQQNATIAIDNNQGEKENATFFNTADARIIGAHLTSISNKTDSKIDALATKKDNLHAEITETQTFIDSNDLTKEGNLTTKKIKEPQNMLKDEVELSNPVTDKVKTISVKNDINNKVKEVRFMDAKFGETSLCVKSNVKPAGVDMNENLQSPKNKILNDNSVLEASVNSFFDDSKSTITEDSLLQRPVNSENKIANQDHSSFNLLFDSKSPKGKTDPSVRQTIGNFAKTPDDKLRIPDETSLQKRLEMPQKKTPQIAKLTQSISSPRRPSIELKFSESDLQRIIKDKRKKFDEEQEKLQPQQDELKGEIKVFKMCITGYEELQIQMAKNKNRDLSYDLKLAKEEHESALDDYRSSINVYNDLARRYEKLKNSFKINKEKEDSLKKSLKKSIEEEINAYKNFKSLESKIQEEILSTKKEVDKCKINCQKEVYAAEAELKLLTVKEASLQREFSHQEQQASELEKLCEELIARAQHQ